MGPSGCGKSTLLNIIGGIAIPTSGHVFVDSQDISHFNSEQLDLYRFQQIGIVFQFFNLIPELTVFENIALTLEIDGKLTREKSQQITELINKVHLEDRVNHYPNELSGGEQQRVAIVSALIHNPAIILCDEPTGELDSQSKHEIIHLLAQIVQEDPNKTLIVVTHDDSFQLYADRLFYIRDGAISHIITPEKKDLNQKQIVEKLWNDQQEKQKDQSVIELRETIYYLQKRLDKIIDA